MSWLSKGLGAVVSPVAAMNVAGLGGLFDMGKNKFSATPGTDPGQISANYGAGQALYGRNLSVADLLQARAGNANPIDFSAANATLGQGNDLLQQFVDLGNGVGPNPALEQLRQTTAANINNAAGAAASARGINPALAARMAVNAGAGANQTAAGQAAVMTAQQQLWARQAAAGLVGQQESQQAGIAQAQATQQTNNYAQLLQQLGTLGQQNLSQQQILQGALSGQNQINAGVAQQNAQFGQKLLGGLMQGAGAAAGMGAGGAPSGYVGNQIPGAAGGLPPAADMAIAAAHGGEITRGGVRRARSDKDVAREILAGRGRRLAGKRRVRSESDVAREILAKGGRVPRFDEGGEAEPQPGRSKGVLDAVSAWWHRGSEPDSREVAEQVDRALPESLGASKAIQQHRARLAQADAAAASEGKAHGGKIGGEKAVAAQIVMRRYFGGGEARRYAFGDVVAGGFRGMGDALTGTDISKDPFFRQRQAPAPAAVPGAPMLASPVATPEPSSFIGRLFQGAGSGLAANPSPGYARGGAPRPFLDGGGVPGRALVPERDTTKNDTVRALLTPGEQVTRRTIATRPGVRGALEAMNEDPKTADFVAHVVAQRKRGSFRRVVEARKRLSAARGG